MRACFMAISGLLVAAPAAAQEAALPMAAAPAVPASLLPHDLSPLSMFQSADIVVQAVMIGLLLASVATWTVWLAKTVDLAAAKRRLARALAHLAQATSLAEAAESMSISHDGGIAALLIDAASAELHASAQAPDKDGIKERIASRLERIEAATGRGAMRGSGILATIGSTAPFIGLFGTVWGIMNSFIGISVSHTTNLAVVAPGIAEALLATACGLFAAIPAVVMYNAFARAIANYRIQLADASAAVLRLVSRDLDRDATRSQRRYTVAE